VIQPHITAGGGKRGPAGMGAGSHCGAHLAAARSQASPGNALSCRLCRPGARRSLADSGLRGRAS
jgi:hypothetical protein